MHNEENSEKDVRSKIQDSLKKKFELLGRKTMNF